MNEENDDEEILSTNGAGEMSGVEGIDLEMHDVERIDDEENDRLNGDVPENGAGENCVAKIHAGVVEIRTGAEKIRVDEIVAAENDRATTGVVENDVGETLDDEIGVEENGRVSVAVEENGRVSAAAEENGRVSAAVEENDLELNDFGLRRFLFFFSPRRSCLALSPFEILSPPFYLSPPPLSDPLLRPSSNSPAFPPCNAFLLLLDRSRVKTMMKA